MVGFDDGIISDVLQSGKNSRWAEMVPQTCDTCGSCEAGGWAATSGDYYCAACWDIWHSTPPVPAATSGRSSRRAPTQSEVKPKRSKIQLCKLMGRGCDCCSYPIDFSFSAWDWDGATWASLFEESTLKELRGRGYSDAHCHLDVVLQNNKHGCIDWDSKQRICKYWLEGDCPYAGFCEYAHGEEDLRPRDPLTRGDIEPFLKQYVQRRLDDGPILHCLITNCCEMAAIEDTKLIMQVALSMSIDSVFVAFGCHPHDYREYTEEMEAKFLLATDACGRRVVAWGEAGLDYSKNHHESLRPSERQRMIDVFSRQARIAVERKLPLIVHSRDAEDDTLQVLKDCLPGDHKFHIHAYQGNLSMMRQCLDLFPNCIFGVGSMVMSSWPSPGAVDCAKHCPLERLVLETDAPYLSSGPHDIPKLAQCVADLRGISTTKVLETTSDVCKRFYEIADRLQGRA